MGLTMGQEVCAVDEKPSPLGRVPPKGAGEVAVCITVLLIPCGEFVLR